MYFRIDSQHFASEYFKNNYEFFGNKLDMYYHGGIIDMYNCIMYFLFIIYYVSHVWEKELVLIGENEMKCLVCKFVKLI